MGLWAAAVTCMTGNDCVVLIQSIQPLFMSSLAIQRDVHNRDDGDDDDGDNRRTNTVNSG